MSIRLLCLCWSIGAHYRPNLVTIFPPTSTLPLSVLGLLPLPIHVTFPVHPFCQKHSFLIAMFLSAFAYHKHILSISLPTLQPLSPSAAPYLTIKSVCNFKWCLSVAWKKRKWRMERSSEGVFSSMLFPRPSCCQTLKSVSLAFFLSFFFSYFHTFHFLRVINWYRFWQPNQDLRFEFLPCPLHSCDVLTTLSVGWLSFIGLSIRLVTSDPVFLADHFS